MNLTLNFVLPVYCMVFCGTFFWLSFLGLPRSLTLTGEPVYLDDDDFSVPELIMLSALWFATWPMLYWLCVCLGPIDWPDRGSHNDRA